MPRLISSDALKDLIQAGDDSRFILVDVRRPQEYRLDHIPGAINIPVWEMDEAPLAIREDLEQVVFYCRNGMRSKVAAVIALDQGIPEDRLFSLAGGMAAYSGEILLEMPKVAVMADVRTRNHTLQTAMNMEKGAWRFYREAAARTRDKRVHLFLSAMGQFEVAHARQLYDQMDSHHPPEAFDDFFDRCPGDILEGGTDFQACVASMETGEGSLREEDLLDLALEIELSAYDLYKVLGSQGGDTNLHQMFTDLARAEKTHLAKIMAFMAARE